MKKVTKDFETQSEAELKKVGAYEYSLHPTTRVTCLALKMQGRPGILFDYYQMEKPFNSFPPQFVYDWLACIDDPEIIFSAHNSFFETCIYNNVLVKRLGWPKIPLTKRRCTAAKAAAVAIPRNLAGAGAVMRLTVQKDLEGYKAMKKTCKPTPAWNKWKKDKIKAEIRGYNFEKEEPLIKFHTPETALKDYKTLYRYCGKDVLTEEQLDDSLPDLHPFEQGLWFIDQKINLRGIQVDMPVVNKISQIMAKEAKIMNKELDILTMGLVSSGQARDQILDFMWLENIAMPDLKAKTVDDFLANGKVSGDAKKLLEIRRALSKASTAKYKKFQERAASDGRVRDLLMYHGASTGRWGGVGIQPQNFPRGVIKNTAEAIHQIKNCNTEDLKMLYGENLMPLFSSVLRGMFIATPGMELFVEDYSAIEARVLWWIAGHEKGLDLFRKGLDPYVLMAAKIFNKHPLEVTDEERQVGKAAVLGCGFQMGAKKFVTSAWDVYRAKVDIELARIAVPIYRKEHWPVPELWENFNNACIKAIKHPGIPFKVGFIKFWVKRNFLWVELPSGRRLAYREPTLEWKTIYLSPEGDVVQKKDLPTDWQRKKYRSFNAESVRYMATNHKAKKEDCIIPKWTREATYGGKLTENIVQAIARDLLAAAIVRADKTGFHVLMHSHDEMVCEAPIGKFRKQKDEKGNFYSPEYRKVMETLPAWAEGLPLKSSGWVGTRYRKG